MGVYFIGDVFRFIVFGDVDVMVVGGVELCIYLLIFVGFGRLKLLFWVFNDNFRVSFWLFDVECDGFVVGEGVVVFVFEEFEYVKVRGVNVLVEIRGYGCSGDVYYVIVLRGDGLGVLVVMKRVLKNVGLKLEEVDYINVYVIGILIGDVVEVVVIWFLMMGE